MDLTLLRKYNLAGAIAVDSATVQYITHCALSEGIIVLSQKNIYLFVDNRYAVIAKGLPSHIQVIFVNREEIEQQLTAVLTSIQGQVAIHGRKISLSF